MKAVDLVSFWWTKSKKLTPELKKIMFGNIFGSPFAKEYLFIQGNSYESLSREVSQRSIVGLGEEDEYGIKGNIVA